MKFTAALIASVAAASPANWADYDAMTVWLKDHDVNNTHEDLMLEVAVAKYGEALEISAHDDNDIIIELTGLPATATLSYQDSTTGIPDGRVQPRDPRQHRARGHRDRSHRLPRLRAARGRHIRRRFHPCDLRFCHLH